MLHRLFVIVLILMTTGCATILDGSNQPVTFNSSPNGAQILVNGMQMGVTPLTTQVKRSKTAMILVKKEGYQEQQLTLQTKVNTYFWGNILFFGGLYSSTTDYASDAMIEYSPNMYYIALNPLPRLQSHEGGLGAEREVHARIEPESSSTERRVRIYVVRNHRSLMSDISKGRGEYLSSLCALLRLPESRDTVNTLRLISSRHPQAPSFAESLLRQFPGDNAPIPR